MLWYIADWIPTIDRVQQARAYQAAFDQWERVCGLNFDQTTEREAANFLIGTRMIDGEGGTLAEHQLPHNDQQLRGWFDVGDKWTTKHPHGQDVIDLVAVATHEFGHGIGLPHSTTPGNLMLPFYDPAVRVPMGNDIYEAQRRYGKPEQPPEPVPEVDYPVLITMASGNEFPVLKPNLSNWGEA